ncbi:hypothetical protein [Spiroplasma turonicum]|uniref:Lipoprotein n=1 Tax=Spiroplasma turonicum TaxID=216946 RepID=A0A0K1P8S8_9MOLU|nr:hypothetical protein [Spiroplasma turonicum]AKU80302.1 hypothetical protein STURON_001056 [Spiroplasma turonicum]ALX71303.1 hypothetical protein STURO_v1c10520 [Spiroplasma turonicum]
MKKLLTYACSLTLALSNIYVLTSSVSCSKDTLEGPNKYMGELTYKSNKSDKDLINLLLDKNEVEIGEDKKTLELIDNKLNKDYLETINYNTDSYTVPNIEGSVINFLTNPKEKYNSFNQKVNEIFEQTSDLSNVILENSKSKNTSFKKIDYVMTINGKTNNDYFSINIIKIYLEYEILSEENVGLTIKIYDKKINL